MKILGEKVATALKSPWSYAIGYLLLAGSWVVLSDAVLASLEHLEGGHGNLHTYKDLSFVLVSSLIVGLLVHRDRLYRIRASQGAVEEYRLLLERLASLEVSIGAGRDLIDIYRALKDFVVKSVPVNGLIVSRYDPRTRLRHCVYAYVEGVEEDVEKLPPLPLSESGHSKAVMTGETVVIGDRLRGAATGPRVDLGMDRDSRPARSSVAVPMLIDGQVIGAFEVQSAERAAYTEEHVTALRMAGQLLAIATANARLLESEREARSELARSEAMFRSVIQNSSDMIRMLSPDGKILYESPSVERILGYESRATKGTTTFQRIHPDDVDFVKDGLRRGVEGDFKGPLRYRVKHTDGSWRWLESVASNLLDDPHVNAFVVHSRDVTDWIEAARSLQEEQEFTQTVLEHLPGVFYLIDSQLRYVKWNKNLETVTGYSSEELGRAGPFTVLAQEDHARVGELIAAALDGEAVVARLTLVTRTGESLPYLCTGVKVNMSGEQFVAGIGIDVSEQVEGQAKIESLNLQLRERVDRLTALHEIDQAITGSLDLRTVLHVLLDQVRHRLGIEAAAVCLLDEHLQELRVAATKGLPSSYSRRAAQPLEAGIGGQAVVERKLIHRSASMAVEPRLPYVDGFTFQSCWALPLIAKGRVLGVLELYSRAGGVHDEDWYHFLETLATQASLAIDGARLFEDLEHKNTELRLAYDKTIEGWARALELKDEETEGHSRRVTESTIALARYMSVSEADIVHVRRGALLHDIGKMGVPDEILAKPGALSDDEWQIMKRHPLYARDLLAPIPFLRPAIDIPYCHHERWDGSGYPRGLKGEDIPLPARIFAVVDVFDALTNRRPYRDPWPDEQALEHLRSQTGMHFDPEVVRAFLRMRGDVGA